MEKEEVLERLRSAKEADVKWVQKAKMLIDGIDMEEDAIPVDSKECKFGKWFYSDGQILKNLSNNPMECMLSIEKLHLSLHEKYKQIFDLYFSQEEKAGFFAKLFGGKKKKELSAEELEESRQFYKELENISKAFSEEISRLERRLVAVSEEKIQSLV